MQSWKEYIKSNIVEFREGYEKFSRKEKKIVEQDELLSLISLNKPCPVVVIDLAGAYAKCFITLHNKKDPDMEIEVLKLVALEDLRYKLLKKVRLLETLTPKVIRRIKERTSVCLSIPRKRRRWSFISNVVAFFVLEDDPRTLGPYSLSDFIHRILPLRINHLQLGETVSGIKRDANEIPEGEIRTKIVEAVEKLENQIKHLDKKLKEEVSGVRQIIGTSEKYLDWKAFASDFEYVQKTHITKDVFDAHVKRLDERIEKGLEALNTRIEDLKAIKFWSKRTILEVVLVIWGTIVSLYAAGILKF